MPQGARFPAESPASKKDMKNTWRRNPWHWFWFNPREVADEIRSRGGRNNSLWADTIIQCESVAMNKRYQVLIKTLDAPPFGEVAHLYITRRDNSLIRPWADFQRIKNDICGSSFTAMEIYPPEDELVDDIDMWHLWCLPPGIRIPFWIGNARGDDVEWTFPGLGPMQGSKDAPPPDKQACPYCDASGQEYCMGPKCRYCEGKKYVGPEKMREILGWLYPRESFCETLDCEARGATPCPMCRTWRSGS